MSDFHSQLKSVPTKYWIVGVVIVLGVIGTIGNELKRSKREANQAQKIRSYAAALPNNSTGRQWLAASEDAKEWFIEKHNTASNYRGNAKVLDAINLHFEMAQRHDAFKQNLSDTVTNVIDKYIADEKRSDSSERKEFWANKAMQEKDPKMRQEYFRRYRSE